MLANDPPHVAAVRAGLAAEARRVGAQLDGQRIGLQRLIAVDIGHGDLGRGNQPEIVSLALEQVLFEFGQLPRAEEAGRIHQEGRQHLGIAVLAGVHVEHEVDERALELRAHAPIEGKARAGDLGRALEIQDAQLRAQVPVRLGLEIEAGRLAHAPHLDVRVRVPAHRHGFVRHVGDAGQNLAELLVERGHLPLERGDLNLQCAHLLLAGGGIGALAAQVADFGALHVQAGLQPLALGDGHTAPPIDLAKLVQAGNIAAPCETPRNLVRSCS